ncbi:MAG: four helix bundle protein [Candidatus Brocadia sp.]|nr:four helix bundle protein [Candidatus Brocadia sp.]
MENKDIVERTYNFALRVIKLVSSLPQNKVCEVIGGQLLKSGTSVGANMEEAQAAYSKKEFCNKIGISHKEARESNYWLRLLKDSGQVKAELIKNITSESEEIVKILFSIGKKSKVTAK